MPSAPRPAAPPRVAVLVPCFNEAGSIAKVVSDFRRALPKAEIYIYDNASADRTAEVARKAGAVVRREPRRGKGHVVARMFADVEADIYLLVDGDDTYDAAAAPALVAALLEGQNDLVNAARRTAGNGGFRAGHRAGNRMFNRLVASIFGYRAKDMLSGYKAMSRRFVKSFPIQSGGFEIETELMIHALQIQAAVVEIEADYRDRGEGSESKLKTVPDGLRILSLILHMLREEKPLQFFCTVGALAALVGLALAAPVVIEYLHTGLVRRFPTAILATGIEIAALLCIAIGFVLDSVACGRREMKRVAYLAIPPVA